VPLHIIQRGNNRQVCFYSDDDYQFYLDWLKEYAEKAKCLVHAYALMTNHVHLLISPENQTSAGNMMKRLGQRYAQYVNRTYQRSGTLWEGRFRSCLTQEENYVLSCYRYIELNPVRACMVEHPAEYRWSSFRSNAQGEGSNLLSAHGVYISLGGDVLDRCSAYRELFRYNLEPGLIDEIRQATNGNYALGTDRFKFQVEAALGRRARPGKSGRPKKFLKKPKSGELF
jgi:putative transposase